MDEILIVGNVVSLRSVSETKKISTEEFYQSLSQCVGMMTPFQSPTVIFYTSGVDRHDSLRNGTLGIAVFEYIMNSSAFDEMPLILETIDDSLWAEEIVWLYSQEKS